MKALFLLILSLSAHAAIFGVDSREQAGDEHARATALQIPLNFVSSGDHGFDLDFPTLSSQDGYGFCTDEPFANEKISPIACTGFLVAPDLLVTAGHCMVTWTRVEKTVTPQCEAFAWLFDYQVGADGTQPATTNISAERIVRCKEVEYANFQMSVDSKGKVSYGEDIALVRLERPVTGRKLFELAPGTPALGEKISLLGYPLGLPAKTNSGNVKGYGQDFFRTDLTTVGGNSGGPVLNAQGKVAGVLVRSFPDADYVDDGTCRRWNHCDFDTGICQSGRDEVYIRGTEVQRIQALRGHL